MYSGKTRRKVLPYLLQALSWRRLFRKKLRLPPLDGTLLVTVSSLLHHLLQRFHALHHRRSLGHFFAVLPSSLLPADPELSKWATYSWTWMGRVETLD